MATVQNGSGLDVRDPERFYLPYSLWMSSWRVGRGLLMIFSTVRTIRGSLLWSDLVAEPSKTVTEVQRTL